MFQRRLPESKIQITVLSKESGSFEANVRKNLFDTNMTLFDGFMLNRHLNLFSLNHVFSSPAVQQAEAQPEQRCVFTSHTAYFYDSLLHSVMS